MSASRSRPADVLLDLLRSVGARGHSVRFLINAGALFGFTENTIRVALSRLGARGLVDSPARGRYRLAEGTDALNEFVERWRLGEQRVRAWRPGRWLIAHTTSDSPEDRWVLETLGFRTVREGLHTRPDNLVLSSDALVAQAVSLGAADDLLLIEGRMQADVAQVWSESWRPEDLLEDYRSLLRRLAESAARLPALPRDRARLESFRLGGEAIHCLAKDPLLPAELIDTAPRAQLVEAMLDYDRLGKAVWAHDRDAEAQTLPTAQLASAQGFS